MGLIIWAWESYKALGRLVEPLVALPGPCLRSAFGAISEQKNVAIKSLGGRLKTLGRLIRPLWVPYRALGEPYKALEILIRL